MFNRSQTPASTTTAKPLTEEYFSADQVAHALGLSRWTIVRRFEKFPGVIDVGSPERCHKRRYRVLRIPRSALQQFIHHHKVSR